MIRRRWLQWAVLRFAEAPRAAVLHGGRFASRTLIAFAAAAVLLVACNGDAPGDRGSSRGDSIPFEVRGNAEGLFLLYWDAAGSHLAKNRDQIPEASREHVRVESLAVPPEERLPADEVYVADLRKPVDGDRYQVTRLPRTAFEEIGRRLQASQRASQPDLDAPSPSADDPTAQMPTPRDPTPLGPTVGGPSATSPGVEVIVYGASWCGVCRTTARFLRQRGIPFVEKDIEKDPAARHEMEAKARAAGVVPRGVPVIDVRGTLLLGFDPETIDQLLAKPRGIPI